tara:strand:- start:1293 stop:1640 length:348 start_codon:yes stop_codon:yes gene_type:complete
MEEAIRDQVSEEALQTIFYENLNPHGIGKMFQVSFSGFAFKFTGLTVPQEDGSTQYFIIMQPMIEGVKVKSFARNDDLPILEQCMECLNIYAGTDEFKHYVDIIQNQNQNNQPTN